MVGRAADPIEIAIEQLDRVLNDENLQEDDMTEVQDIIHKLHELGERNPFVGMVLNNRN